ncbi:MAG: DUF885 domain-containing protein [Verrucomicrobiaceae bacterium]|nr:DUF885 domain-containing protein [Verrucomicrobiaceae bacterium]
MNAMKRTVTPIRITILVLALPGFLPAQVSTRGPHYAPPDGRDVITSHASDFRDLLDRYHRDRDTYQREFPSRLEQRRIEGMKKFYRDWHKVLLRMDFGGLNRSGKVDYILFRHLLEKDQSAFSREAEHLRSTASLVPFLEQITTLEYRRRAQEKYDPQKLAPGLEKLARTIDAQRHEMEALVIASRERQKEEGLDEIAERRFKTAEDAIRELQRTTESWFNYYRGYDPLLTWWITAPSKRVATALGAYADVFKPDSKRKPEPMEIRKQAGFNGENHVEPAGKDKLAALLQEAMIPYSAAELVKLGKRELAWCVAEQKKVSRELGFGDNTAAALENVKGKHVAPGEQSAVIRRLALEAIAYLEKHELVTIPQLAKDSWRVGMMSPGRQRYNPFFTGGSTISVSYPHEDMEHADKLMSMRGNNPHFSAATVHHELIPGHHLQDFMTSRYNTHRRIYNTVFWTEGWALYWEMLLWDRGFARTPEDRMGFLFWRMHRCVRIIFSLGYHLGEFTPQECVDLLVEVVGHEPAHAEGEVRRSLAPGTPILYQCAYMLGGMQFHVLHQELVASGKMSAREFHDRVLRGNRIPVEMVRAEVSDIPLTRDYTTNWRFAEEFRPD